MILAQPDLPRTFPDTVYGWSDHQWAALPVSEVDTDSLVPSQDDVSLFHLVRFINEPEEDYVGRAVIWNDMLYLFDGHHHWILAAARGEPTFKVRILNAQS